MTDDKTLLDLVENGTFILDTIENGILILESDLTILFWNRWLVINTGINKDTAQGCRLDELFPNASFKLLKRKVKISLKLQSSTFTNSTVDKFIIPIELKKITKSIFHYMRQDAVITPLNDKQVSVVIYDTSPLLEARATINEQLALVQKQATTDALTGCYNKQMFNTLLSAESSRAMRYGSIFTLIIFDIDNFKSVNDTYGHLVGDQVLKALAKLANNCIRNSDIFARWGGEEFTILLPETNLTNGAIVADKIRSVIASYDCGDPGHKTCSFGVAEFFPEDSTNTLVSRADEALYFAKNNGKNQVAIFVQGEIKKWEGNQTMP